MQTLYFFIPLKICFGDDHFTECHCFSGFLPVYYPTQIVKIICTLNMINVHFFCIYIYQDQNDLSQRGNEGIDGKSFEIPCPVSKVTILLIRIPQQNYYFDSEVQNERVI